jgi:hypothetical protein
MSLQQPLRMLIELAAFGGQAQALVLPIEQLEAELALERTEQSPDLRLGAAEPCRGPRYGACLDEGPQGLQSPQRRHPIYLICELSMMFSLLRI